MENDFTILKRREVFTRTLTNGSGNTLSYERSKSGSESPTPRHPPTHYCKFRVSPFVKT